MMSKITIDRAVVEQALDALKASRDRIVEAGGSGWKLSAQACTNAIAALRATLGQQQNEQEPMRKMYVCNSCQFPYADQPPSQCDCLGDETYTEAWLFTSSKPKRTPLTDEAVLGVAKSIEIQFDGERLNEQIDDILAFARAIERAHGIGGDL